jgi:hypothetical protein
MENSITFSAKQEDGITGKRYNQKMGKHFMVNPPEDPL